MVKSLNTIPELFEIYDSEHKRLCERRNYLQVKVSSCGRSQLNTATPKS
jgi:hypothetical protein